MAAAIILPENERLKNSQRTNFINGNPKRKVFRTEEQEITETLQQQITNHVSRLGKGHVEPVAYDTAWVARIPELLNKSQPAFPECLTWLKNNQLPDGSWGSSFPFNAHGNTLCTLAALLALKHWNNPEDVTRIERGVASLTSLAGQLGNETYETIGFELLLPELVSEAKSFGWKIPYDIYETYAQASAEKRQMINAAQKKSGLAKPSSWWFSLESLGGDLLRDVGNAPQLPTDPESLLRGCPSVAASPAATAYLLIVCRNQGKDLPRAFAHLKAITLSQAGGVPNVFPIDEFELSFSLVYFMEAGISANDPILAPAVQKLISCWETRGKTGIGYSSHFIADPDDTSHACTVLHRVNYPLQPAEILAPFFNGNHMETYPGERVPPITGNINALIHLKSIAEESPAAQEMVKQISTWLAGKAKLDNETVFEDKWHCSPVYPISRGVFGFEGLNANVFQACISWLLEAQRTDGGWGHFGESTQEETAHASLALAHAYQHGSCTLPTVESALRRAQGFLQSLQSQKTSKFPLWIGKSLYCPANVVSSLNLAAQHALQKVIRFMDFKRQAFLLPPKTFIHFDLGKAGENLAMRGSFVSIVEKGMNPAYSLIKSQTSTWALEHQVCDPQSKLIKGDHLAMAVAYPFRLEDAEGLRLLSDISLAYIVIDDIMDDEWEKLDPAAVEAALATFRAILADGKEVPKGPSPAASFPRYQGLCLALRNLRERIEAKISDLEYFNLAAADLFGGFLTEFHLRVKKENVVNVKDYINLRFKVGGAEVFFELALAMRKIHLPSEIRQGTRFRKFKRAGLKGMLLTNDLISLRKDIQRGNQENFILLRKRQLGISLQDAFNHVVGIYNRLALKLVIVGRQDAKLGGATSLMEEMLQGHLDWCLESQRYRGGKELIVEYSQAVIQLEGNVSLV